MRIRRRDFTFAGTALLATFGVASQQAAFAAGDETSLAASVEAFRTAMLKADKAQFEVLCAEQMTYGHSSGRVETKAEFIASATSGRSKWNFITLSDATTKVVGSNGVARHTFTGETLSDGKTTPIKIAILMVWQLQGNDWKLLARQAAKI